MNMRVDALRPSTRAFSAALYVLPPAFRREFGDEMTADFTDALGDPDLRASAVSLWLRAVADVFRTAPRLWLASGLPLIAGAAAILALIVAATAARLRPASVPLPDLANDSDLRTLMLLVAVVLVVIANTLIISLWFLQPLLTRHHKLARCSKRGA